MSVVTETRNEAVDDRTSVVGLLRKALVIAHSLELTEFSGWIEKELNGYKENDQIPSYREVRGVPHAHNPFRGWEPIHFSSADSARRCARMLFHYPLAQIEGMTRDAKGGTIIASYSPEWTQRLQKVLRPPGLQPALHIDSSQLRALVDAVRNAVLKWTMDLDKKGISGRSDMSFSKTEKVAASEQTVNIGTYIGSMQQSQIQQDSPNALQTLAVKQLDLEAVGKFIAQFESARPSTLSDSSLAEVNADIASIKAQLASPNPKPSIVREALHSVRAILEQAGGTLAGSGIVKALELLIGP